MRTYACCRCCRVLNHVVYRLGSAMRDEHPYPCARCPPDGRGRQTATDNTKLPEIR